MNVLILVYGLPIAALLLSAYVLHRLREDFLLHYSRNTLFELRSRLFELARERGVPFNAKPYVILRSMLNGMIRFTHDLSVLRVAFSWLFADKRQERIGASFRKQFADEVAQLGPEVAREFKKIEDEAHECMTVFLMNRSVVLYTILLFIESFFALKRAVARVAKALSTPRVKRGVRITRPAQDRNAAVERFPFLVMRPTRSMARSRAGRRIDNVITEEAMGEVLLDTESAYRRAAAA